MRVTRKLRKRFSGEKSSLTYLSVVLSKPLVGGGSGGGEGDDRRQQ